MIGLVLIIFLTSCQIQADESSGDSEICRQEKVPYETTEEYQEEEVYYDSVPYEDEDCNEIEVPYTATEEYQDILFTIEDVLIEPDERLYQKVELSKSMTIEVTFRADDKLNLWAVDDEEFEKLINGEDDEYDNWYIKQTEVSEAQEGFEVSVDDTYIIYLKNQDEWGNEDVSVYEFTAVASWEEEVEKTKTEEYCTTLTKYKEVEKTRTVTKTMPVVKYKTEIVCE